MIDVYISRKCHQRSCLNHYSTARSIEFSLSVIYEIATAFSRLAITTLWGPRLKEEMVKSVGKKMPPNISCDEKEKKYHQGQCAMCKNKKILF